MTDSRGPGASGGSEVGLQDGVADWPYSVAVSSLQVSLHQFHSGEWFQDLEYAPEDKEVSDS